MKKLSPDDLIKVGKRFLKEEKYEKALAVFHEAIKRTGYQNDNDEDIPPRYLSYLGLAMALAEKRFRKGAAVCEKAIKRESHNPILYLNLGKVFAAGGYKRKAIDAFQKGLKIDEANIEIRAEINKIGVRRKPVIAFLPRTHAVNKVLGKIIRGSSRS